MANVKIICRRPGMRRCGAEHPAEKSYKDGYWTDEQLGKFDEDPDFSVVVVGKDSAGGTSSTNGEQKPEGDELIAAIVAQIKKLEPGVKPTVGMLKTNLGYEVAGKELGAAMKVMKSA